ncbi:hypothetical protein [Ruminococcus sp.]|uniref:hypothetical protein n=1 Tax=Ruminococcus sp. TaxID=41978 RepID=UPI0025DCBC5D|nr:hypothetical protein [Ruminococcus sp.]MBQ8965952.1 hypothetical protein [Ruminococcus sp.]
MDSKISLKKGTEVTPYGQNSSTGQGFQGNGSFYTEDTPQPPKHGLRIQAAIPPKTFNRIVIGAVVVMGAAAIAAVIKLIIFLSVIF